jgi:hypothetical protein
MWQIINNNTFWRFLYESINKHFFYIRKHLKYVDFMWFSLQVSLAFNLTAQSMHFKVSYFKHFLA